MRPFAAEWKKKERAARRESRRLKLSEGHKRAIKRAAAAVAAVAVLAAAVGIGLSWKSDMDLRAQAEQVADGKNAKAGSAAEDTGTAEVSAAAQTGTGGSSVVSDGVNLYWATGEGVYVLPVPGASSKSKSKPERIVSGAASCLNVCGDDLYFLQGGSVARLEAVRAAASGDDGDAKPETLYTAGEGSQLTALVVRGDTVLVLEQAEGHVRALSVAGDGAAPVCEADAASAWLFADDQSATLVTSTDTAWQAMQASLGSAAEASSWHQVFTGDGSLKAAFFAGTALYQSIEGDGAQAKVTRRETTGSFNEYTDLAGTVLLSGDSRGCAALTAAGGLAWIDADTGFSHDLTSTLEQAGVSLTPSSTSIWCEGTTIYLLADASSGSGALYSIDASMDPATMVTIKERA